MNKASWKVQFVKLWIGQAASVFTSSIVQMSLVWYIAATTDSPAMLTLGTLIGFGPRVIVGMFSGVYIDRQKKKTVMIAADLFVAMFSLLVVIVGQQRSIPIWLVMIVLLGRAIGSSFHEPALQAATPLIVPKESLTQYAGYGQAFQAISDLLTPTVAALLYAVLPIQRIMLFDIGGAAVAVSMLIFIKIPEKTVTGSKAANNFRAEFMAGINILRSTRGMMMLMMVCALYAVIYSPIGTLFPLMSMSHFGKGVNGSAIVETVFAAGTLAGSFLLGITGRKIKAIPAIAMSIGLYGTGVLITGLLPPDGFWFFVVIAGIMGISIPFYYGIRTAVLQRSFPAEVMGRIMSLAMSLTRIATPVGLIMAGAFAEVIGVDKWFAISGALAIVLAVFTARAKGLKGCGD